MDTNLLLFTFSIRIKIARNFILNIIWNDIVPKIPSLFERNLKEN